MFFIQNFTNGLTVLKVLYQLPCEYNHGSHSVNTIPWVCVNNISIYDIFVGIKFWGSSYLKEIKIDILYIHTYKILEFLSSNILPTLNCVSNVNKLEPTINPNQLDYISR